MGRLIIKNGTLVTPEGTLRADLIVEGETIASIAAAAEVREGDQVIDAAEMLVLPGMVDAHTHIKLDTGLFQTADNWEIGSKAAAAGGVTTVIDFANQIKGKPYSDALAARCAEAAPSIIDYTFHMVVLEPDRDPDKLQDDLRGILELGISSLKLFTTYRPNYYLDDAALLHLFKAMPSGLTAMVHCENDSLVSDATKRLVEAGHAGWHYHAQGRPPEAEIEAINRVLMLATFGGGTFPIYIAHCSTVDAAWGIEEFKDQFPGYVHFETCPQYLLLDDTVYEGKTPERYILQPPLRSPEHPDMLRNLVIEGLVDVISTDTCDYTIAQKTAKADFTQTPGGLPGIETLLPMMYSLFCHELGEPVEKIIQLMTGNPARIFGIYPRKGALQVGSDADIVLYDPRPENMIHHKDLHYVAGYSPYEGMKVKGKVRATISRGDVIYQDGAFPSGSGRGRFVRAQPVFPNK
jgi:dihydropyrimidinase